MTLQFLQYHHHLLRYNAASRGGQVVGTGMVFWTDKDREQSIQSLAEDIAKTF